MAWTRAGVRATDLPEGTMKDAQLGGRAVLLLAYRGKIAAFQGRCPHEEGVLAEGTLDGGKVVCPLHGATYDATSGTIVADPDGVVPPSGDVPSLRVYPVRITGGEVEVDLA